MNIPAHMTCLSCAHSRGDYRGEYCLLEQTTFPEPCDRFDYEPGTDEIEREEEEE